MKNDGFFGEFGGAYAPEVLMPILGGVEEAFLSLKEDANFMAEFNDLLKNYAGRPTPLYHAKNTSKAYGAQIWFKREDLLHGGAHKTNNAVGQALLAKRMGKTRLIAETGAGQHGVAMAMAGALVGIDVEIYMGAVDVARQAPNVDRMRLLGATVHAVESGGRTLKDAINDAMRDWIANSHNTHYAFGTVAGPHPFPTMVKFFHECIGREARAQSLEQLGKLPDYVLACVGGGSNAIGIFQGFTDDRDVKLIGVEPAGMGTETEKHGAVLAKGVPAVMHAMRSLALQDEDGQMHETHSISAGLDYPMVGPEHAYLQSVQRANYTAVTDDEAVEAMQDVAKYEGILAALESSHAVAEAKKLAAEVDEDTIILVNLSGRGDKDLGQVTAYLKGEAIYE